MNELERALFALCAKTCAQLPRGEQAQFLEDLSYDLGQLAAELRAAEHRAAR